MILTMQFLENCFNSAKKNNMKYVAVKIRIKGYKKDEIIINQVENFDEKLAYYKISYDNELNHRYSTGVSIVGFTYGDTFGSIEKDLIYN